MVKIVPNYYDTLPPYMETIFNLTKHAIEKDEEEVAKQAIEFWSSICEEEIDLIEVRPAIRSKPIDAHACRTGRVVTASQAANGDQRSCASMSLLHLSRRRTAMKRSATTL